MVAPARVVSPDAREKVTLSVWICVLEVTVELVRVMLPVVESEEAPAAVTFSLPSVLAAKPLLVTVRFAAARVVVELAWALQYAHPAPVPASTLKAAMPATREILAPRPIRPILMRPPASRRRSRCR
ncbi:hypothetical protein FJ656_14560 [Schumannella luteola]|nr:hypothetical protein FJ656_14560 [Schumannella luteola]